MNSKTIRQQIMVLLTEEELSSLDISQLVSIREKEVCQHLEHISRSLKGIDYAFLPMNLPYTMTPEMVADAAVAFKPKVLYPYHFGETDTARIVALLKGRDTEVRIRETE